MAGGDALAVTAAESVALGGMALLGKYGPAWASTLAKIELAGKLAKPAMGAGAVWLLAQPWDDEAISKAFNDWRTINLKLTHLRTREWDNKLKAIQAAWPEGADRLAFDRFMGVIHQEIQQLETAAMQMANAVQNAQSDIHKIVSTAGVIVNGLLAIIIASEIMQMIPATKAAAKATQEVAGLVLMGSTINAVVGITATLIFSLGNLTSLMSAGNQFPMAQANLDSDGTDKKTDFDDITRNLASKSDQGWSYA